MGREMNFLEKKNHVIGIMCGGISLRTIKGELYFYKQYSHLNLRYFVGNNFLSIEYCGNMGNRKRNVIELITKLFSFNILDCFKLIEESGSPDYLYNARIALIEGEEE